MNIEELKENALDILKYDGDVNDTLVELRQKWGKEIPALFDARFDTIGAQYIRLSHEAGVAALGQELTTFDYALYDLDGDEIYLFVLLPLTGKDAFEKSCRKAGQYCKQMKQPSRKWGMSAKEVDPGALMICEEELWSDDAYYMLDSIAGDYASGQWKAEDAETWQGSFVVDLRRRPLVPIKVKWKNFCRLTYSAELDFYAAYYSPSSQPIWTIVGGKNPLETDQWVRLCDVSINNPKNCSFVGHPCWLGHHLCFGDEQSAVVLTMNEKGVENVRRLCLPREQYPGHFGMDGLGRIYIDHGYHTNSIFCYENGEFTSMPFTMYGYDHIGECLPIPGTSRLLIIRSYNDNGNFKASLFDLDMETRRCRAVPLPGIGENAKLCPFFGDWVLIKGTCGDLKDDFAQLWNWQTNEILRIRPGMFGSEKLGYIGALRNGTVVFTTYRPRVWQVIHYPVDFWNFLRTANKPKRLGQWRTYSELYPNIPFGLPPKPEK